jgi:hypothetical protein
MDLVNEPILFRFFPHVWSLHLHLFCELSKKIVVDMMLKLSAKLLELMVTIELQDENAPKENNREENSNFNRR